MKAIFQFVKSKITLLFTVQFLTLFIWLLLISWQWVNSPKSTSQISDIVIIQLIRFGIFLILSSLIFKFYDLFQNKRKTFFFWILVIIITLISAYIIEIAENVLKSIVFNTNKKIIGKHFFFTGSYYIMPVLLLTVIYIAVRYWENAQREKEKTLKSQALAHEAQLQMLRYQINPHFLFNALNTIRATIALDQDKARNTVTLLSDFFRYTLEKDQEHANSIGKEIEAIKNYLDIQKIRFEEKIEFNFNIDPETENIEIPFFIIHPLVENAVKYGIETSEKPLVIKILTALLKKDLVIEVTNSGSLVSESENKIESTNTGLDNIRKRLDLVYPEQYKLNLKEKEKKVTASLLINNIV